MSWSKDLQDSIPYEEYARSIPCLTPLVFSATLATRWAKDLRKLKISEVSPGDTCTIDLRAFDTLWYSKLPLPDKHTLTYTVECVYQDLQAGSTKIGLHCPLLKHTRTADNVFLLMYGLRPPPGELIALEESYLRTYPDLLRPPGTSKASSTKDFEYLVGKDFFDPDVNKTYVVTRIAVTPVTLDIVAYVRPFTERGRPSKEETSPFHVQDVVNMLKD